MGKAQRALIHLGATPIFVVLVVLGLSVGSFADAATKDQPVVTRALQPGLLSHYPFATPVFGLATGHEGRLLVADFGAGIVELRKDTGTLIANLPGVTDIAPIGRSRMYAVTGGGPFDTAGKLFSVSRGNVREIADLAAFEASVNPDGGFIDSNPFDVAALSEGKSLIADAAGNDLLIVDSRGRVDWVAVFPNRIVSTDNAKLLAGCPNPPPELAFACGLPPMMPAEAVPTSVAVGPDGAYYVGELTGFPGPTGMSRIWRIEPGTRHVVCGADSDDDDDDDDDEDEEGDGPGGRSRRLSRTASGTRGDDRDDDACTLVADGFTAIIDLTFSPDGKLLVVELDEAGFLGLEWGGSVGGTVNSCRRPRSRSGNIRCEELATGLPMSTAAAVSRGQVHVVIWALVPGLADVIALP